MRKLTRRKFLRNSAALTTTSLLNPGSSKAQVPTSQSGDRPNILIFMPDQQQGATVLPEHPCLTPNVDRLAREGVMFTQACCPSPHCWPSRARFQTGLYPSEHGVFNNVDTDTAIHANPYPGLPYFSRILRDSGYDLAYSGKWHVARARLEAGRGLGTRRDVPWPPLSPDLAEVRRGLLKQMWKFAQEHKDQVFNPYITVAMAPLGPGVEL
jgi:arylsulfatase A-like enzyme